MTFRSRLGIVREFGTVGVAIVSGVALDGSGVSALPLAGSGYEYALYGVIAHTDAAVPVANRTAIYSIDSNDNIELMVMVTTEANTTKERGGVFFTYFPSRTGENKGIQVVSDIGEAATSTIVTLYYIKVGL